MIWYKIYIWFRCFCRSNIWFDLFIQSFLYIFEDDSGGVPTGMIWYKYRFDLAVFDGFLPFQHYDMICFIQSFLYILKMIQWYIWFCKSKSLLERYLSWYMIWPIYIYDLIRKSMLFLYTLTMTKIFVIFATGNGCHFLMIIQWGRKNHRKNHISDVNPAIWLILIL